LRTLVSYCGFPHVVEVKSVLGQGDRNVTGRPHQAYLRPTPINKSPLVLLNTNFSEDASSLVVPGKETSVRNRIALVLSAIGIVLALSATGFALMSNPANARESAPEPKVSCKGRIVQTEDGNLAIGGACLPE
jgi:hypothetical protein